jgi:hypothetical protein
MTPAWLERAKANVVAAAQGKPEPFPMEPPPAPRADGYRCRHCGETFLSRHALAGHMNHHTRRARRRRRMGDYAAFLAQKAVRAKPRGLLSPPPLATHLFPFQAHCVEFGLRMGASGLFLDTGLGKTECQLEWCSHALRATNGKALILTPLAVAAQTQRRAERWGYEAFVVREASDVRPGINICNYDRLDKLDPATFGAVALDEASILKGLGRTASGLIDTFRDHRFKLVATATPAPNDSMEIGRYSEFLAVMSGSEMLSRFFINDTSTASQQWRLKGHAVVPFWDWLASWSRMAERPSDLGDSDDGFILPPFTVKRHRSRDVALDNALADLFGTVTMSATTMHDVKRQTSEARAETASALVAAEPGEPWIIWCDTDYEADALKRAIPSAIEVRGSQSADEKEERLLAFATGQAKHLIGKPAMIGLGMDWSHCARMAFVGRSYSYEAWYQAVRRCWRFGQKRELMIHLIVAEGESEIGRVIDRKAGDHARMKIAMRDAMARNAGAAAIVKEAYAPKHIMRLPAWT